MTSTTSAITSPLQLLAVQQPEHAKTCPLCGRQHPGRICPRIVEIEFYADTDARPADPHTVPVRRIHLFPEA